MIQTTTVTADKNPKYATPPGNNTKDKVFLLSIPEANKYFSSDEARMCAPTDYAIAQGAVTNDNYSVDGKAAGWWWLRSPGGHDICAALVAYDGGPSSSYHGNDGVRPALWINLGS